MNTEVTANQDRSCRSDVDAAEPSGAPGQDDGTVTVCRCGAGPHPEYGARCEAGHVVAGNLLALTVGHRSPRAQAAHRPAVQARVRELVEAKGYTEDQAPPDLRIIGTHLAWSERWRAEADERIEQSGGPLTSAGRERRALKVAEKWDRRVESWNRQYSQFPERSEPIETLEEYILRRQREAVEHDDQDDDDQDVTAPRTSDLDGTAGLDTRRSAVPLPGLAGIPGDELHGPEVAP